MGDRHVGRGGPAPTNRKETEASLQGQTIPETEGQFFDAFAQLYIVPCPLWGPKY